MSSSKANRRLITFLRIIKTGGQNFVRNAWLSIAAMAVMVITLSIVLFSIVASATFNHTIDQITDRIDISVYLKDTVSDEERQTLTEQVNRLPNVSSVEYISKEQALADYKQANQEDLDLLLAISQTDNPLPASLRIKPEDPNRIEEIRAFIEKPEVKQLQSDETSYSGDRKEAIDNITNATRFFQRLGVVGVLIFFVVSVLIILNTIQMAIFNRREELQIMRLLGASTWYIRGPFIVEAIYYGIAAAAISVIISQGLLSVPPEALQVSSLSLLDINFASQYFNERLWLFLTLQLTLGILIGAVSSFIATRRYLKFKTTK